MTEKGKAQQIQIDIHADNLKRPDEQMADLRLSGLLTSAELALYFSPKDSLDGTETLLSIQKQATSVINGDTGGIETMLISQAIALNAIFSKLSIRANKNFGEYLGAGETYLRLALKAQSQCRATLETLVDIKNPRPYIQNNCAEYQQVNNGTCNNTKTNTRASAHAGKTFSTNELLDDKSYGQEWLDTRAPREAV